MLDKHTDFDPVITAFKNLIVEDGITKLKSAGVNVEQLYTK